jgi:hypothetical protein
MALVREPCRRPQSAEGRMQCNALQVPHAHQGQLQPQRQGVSEVACSLGSPVVWRSTTTDWSLAPKPRVVCRNSRRCMGLQRRRPHTVVPRRRSHPKPRRLDLGDESSARPAAGCSGVQREKRPSFSPAAGLDHDRQGGCKKRKDPTSRGFTSAMFHGHLARRRWTPRPWMGRALCR